MISSVIDFLGKVKSPEVFKRGVNEMFSFVQSFPESFPPQIRSFIEPRLKSLQKTKTTQGEKDLATYIKVNLEIAGSK